MKTGELIAKIDGVILRETAIRIYSEHIMTSVHWAGIDGKKMEEVKTALQTLHDDSIVHAKGLKRVRGLVLKKK